MGNFRQAAEDSLTLSRLHKNRNKIDTADVVKYKDGLTVEDFDLIQRDDGAVYPVFTFEELPDVYYQSGIVGTKIVMAWAEMYNDDVLAAASAYKKDKEKVRLIFAEEKCKNDKSKNVTTIKVV